MGGRPLWVAGFAGMTRVGDGPPILTFPHEGGEGIPRPAPPLWVAGFAGMTREGRGPSTGSGRTESGTAPTVIHCVRFPPSGPAVRIPPALPLWIPAFAGMTRGGAAPLGCWLRGNDESWGRAGPSTGSGRTESRVASTVMHGVRFSLGGSAVSIPPASPLWVPAKAGMTREGRGGTLPHPNLPPEGEGISRAAALGCCFRGNDEEAVCLLCLFRKRVPIPAPPLWIPAFAGKTGGGRVTFGGCGGRIYVLFLLLFSYRTGVRRSRVWTTGQELCSWNARSSCWPLGSMLRIFCGSFGGCAGSRGLGRVGVGRCGRRSW